MEYISLYLQRPFLGYTGQGSFLCHNAVSSSMDYSNATIAEALGVSASTVSKILAGDI